MVTTLVTLGGRHVLVLGQGAEGHGPVDLDGGEGGELARGQAGVGLAAQDAGQAGGAEAQPGGDGRVARLTAGCGRGAGRSHGDTLPG